MQNSNIFIRMTIYIVCKEAFLVWYIFMIINWFACYSYPSLLTKHSLYALYFHVTKITTQVYSKSKHKPTDKARILLNWYLIHSVSFICLVCECDVCSFILDTSNIHHFQTMHKCDWFCLHMKEVKNDAAEILPVNM